MSESMMNDGGPAFPCITDKVIVDPKGERIIPILNGGMTLRDYFAAKAMQSAHGALCASHKSVDGNEETLIARLAYRLADAMLAERAKGGAA